MRVPAMDQAAAESQGVPMTDKCRTCKFYKRIDWNIYPFFLWICKVWKRPLGSDELDGCPEYKERDHDELCL